MRKKGAVNYRNRDCSDLSLFKCRLLALMLEQHIETTTDLAALLFDKQLITCKSTIKDYEPDQKQLRTNAIATISRRIQEHLDEDTANRVKGEYIIAYSKFFGCSSDYLFGFTDIRSPSIDVQQICQKTNLSEDIVQKLIEETEECEESREAPSQGQENNTFYYSKWWASLLSHMYESLPEAWLRYAFAYVEREGLRKKTEALSKAADEIRKKKNDQDTDIYANIVSTRQIAIEKLSPSLTGTLIGAYQELDELIGGYFTRTAAEWGDAKSEHVQDKIFETELKKWRFIEEQIAEFEQNRLHWLS